MAVSRWDGDDLLLTVYVQPRASRDEFAGRHGDAVKVRITAPPVDGKANAHLVKFLASEFGVARNAVELVTGQAARLKQFRVHAPRKLPFALGAAESRRD